MKLISNLCTNQRYYRHEGAGLIVVSLGLFLPNWMHADPLEFEASTSVASSSIDRGETLALTNNESEILIIKSTPFVDLSAGLSRITPFGDDSSIFDDELSLSLGASFESSASYADFSVSYLSFPDSEEPPAIELVAELGLAQTLNPTLSVFYDLRSDTRGGEFTLSHPIQNSLTDLQLVLRTGVVSATEQDYSYVGLEGILGVHENEHFTIEAFLRSDAADENTFVSEIRSNGDPGAGAQAWAIGLRFAAVGVF